jgi:hypothetical protein
MASLITNPNEFCAKTDLMYGAPKPYGPGKKVPVLNKKTKRGLVIRCPWLLTYGANGYVNPKEPNSEPDMSKVSMSLQFPRDEFATDKTREFLQTIQEMEDQILNDAFKHSRDWLGQVFEQPGYMKALYTPLLNYPMDKQAGVRDRTRAPTIKVKIPRDEKTQQYRTEIFNVTRTQLYPNEDDVPITEIIPKGSMVACNLYCAGIWVAGGKFGVIWNLSQAMVKPSESFKKGECYLPSVDEDGNPIEEQNKVEVVSDTPKEAVQDNHESDGEDEHPPQPVVEEPPHVVEEPKKKVVKKGGPKS